jgi:hypothetical protein
VVTLIVGGHGHDRAGAVGHQHVVGHPDRHARAVDRVDGVGAGEHAGLLLLGGDLAVHVGAVAGGADVGLDLGPAIGRGELAHQRVLRREDAVGHAEERVGAGGVDREALVRALDPEAHLGALRAADPLPLHLQHTLGPVEALEVVERRSA